MSSPVFVTMNLNRSFVQVDNKLLELIKKGKNFFDLHLL